MSDRSSNPEANGNPVSRRIARVRQRLQRVSRRFLRQQWSRLTPLEQRAAWVVFLLRHVWTRFDEGRVSQRAAGLAFHTALSVVPIMVIAVSVAGALGLLEGASDALVDAVFAAWVPVDDDTIRVALDRLISQAGSAYLGSIGLLFFLYTSISLFNEADQLFNDAWEVGRRRPILKRIVLFWMILTVAPPLVTASVVASSWIQVVVVSQLGALQFSDLLVPTLFPVMLTWAALLFAMVLLPNTQVRFRAAMIVSLITAVVFEIGKLGFGYYVSQFASVSWFRIYGAIFLVPVLLLWIYVSWMIIAAGVLLSASVQNFEEAVLRQSRVHRRFREGAGTMVVLEVCLLLVERLRSGEGSMPTTALARECALARADAVKVLELLERAGVVECLMGMDRNERRWTLREDPSALTVGSLLDRCRAFAVEETLPHGTRTALAPLADAYRKVGASMSMTALAEKARRAGPGAAAQVVEGAVLADESPGASGDLDEGREVAP